MGKILNKTNLTARQIIDIVLLLLLLIFIGQNLEGTQVKFLFFKFEIPLVILIFIIFFVGFYTSRVFVGKGRNKKEKDVPYDNE